MKPSKKFTLFFGTLILGIAADQITKYIAVTALYEKGFVAVIGDFLGFELVENPGAFLGMFSGARWMFMIPSAIAIILLTVWMFKVKAPHPLFAISLSLFVCGGIGNMIDRIRLGKVIDFIALHFGSYRFPNFNFADSCVTVGAALFFIYCFVPGNTIFGGKKDKPDKSETENPADSGAPEARTPTDV